MNETLINVLKNNKLRNTTARQSIISTLAKAKTPLSMRELVLSVDGGIDRASVYRTINLFEKIGIVKKINIGWKYKIELGDDFIGHHHHMLCDKCHQTITIKDSELESLVTKIAKKYGFDQTGHQIEINGLCKNCKN